MIRSIGMLSLAIVLCTSVHANDWPTLNADAHRSSIAQVNLSLPLEVEWVRELPRPQMAWEGPAKWDAYSGKTDLKSMRNFDPAYFVTVVGERAYYGSSVDDAAHCIDAATGEEIWAYFTDGPVRFPPTIANGKAYFGSDDGYAYCVDAASGAFVWKYKALKDERYIPVNGKLVSLAPVRSSVLVDDGTAYFAASLLPWRPSYLCAVDAETGSVSGDNHYSVEHSDVTFQGAVLLTSDYVYALQGRSEPIVFERATGERKGAVRGTGGAYALITDEETFISGAPSQKVDQIAEATVEKRDQIASYPNANRIVVRAGIAYLQSEDELSAFNRAQFLELQGQIMALNEEREKNDGKLKELRKEREAAGVEDPTDEERALSRANSKLRGEVRDLTEQLPDCFAWKVPCTSANALVLAGDTLFAGGGGIVEAFSVETGERVWSHEVSGVADGLAVAQGRLFVSTDAGNIYAFGQASGE